MTQNNVSLKSLLKKAYCMLVIMDDVFYLTYFQNADIFFIKLTNNIFCASTNIFNSKMQILVRRFNTLRWKSKLIDSKMQK